MLSPKDFSGAPKPKSVDELPQAIADDFTSVAGLVHSRFQRAKIARQQEQELIHLDCYRSWRGQNSPQEQASIDAARQRMGAASSFFIKITKTKTTAAYGQICEILFANNKFPIGVEPDTRPQGIEDTVTVVPEGVQYGDQITDPYGYKGDGREIPAGATPNTLINNLKASFSSLLGKAKLVYGNSPDPKTMPEIHPAQLAATNLERVMQTQLEIGQAEKILRKAAYECTIYGTGIMKGPFSYNEIRPNWTLNDDETVTYNPETFLIPKFSHVSVWGFYPDPDAEKLEECEYVVERHLLSRHQLKMLCNRPKFNREAINELLLEIPTHQTEFWEQQIGKYRAATPNHKYEVLEYWGSVDKELLNILGVDTSKVDLDVVQVNVWTCRHKILRIVINPFLPVHLPYHIVNYEEHPHRIWGVGVPENMADCQKMMNGHYRMMIDNLRLAGSLVFEVRESSLVPGQDFTIFPGKVFRTHGGQVGQSIFGLKFPNTAEAHMQAFDKTRMLSDEATGIPSYAHGQTGVSGQTRTASGMSMLMSAAALNIKTVAANFDTLITSIGQGLFNWNMQFNVKDKDIRGNTKIIAKGTASLMQREVVTQRLLSLLQLGGNPAVAPFLKADQIIKEIVRNMDLDGDKFVNDPVQAQLYAKSMSQMQQPQTAAPVGQGGNGPSPDDQTGGGNGQISPSIAGPAPGTTDDTDNGGVI
jgi:hypothetical protein